MTAVKAGNGSSGYVLAGAGETKAAEPPSTGNGGESGVLWVRQDPWESARQPAIPPQTRVPPVANHVDGIDGHYLPTAKRRGEHSSSNGSDGGARHWQRPPSGNGTAGTAAGNRQLSKVGSGHRAAVFDNVE